MKKFLLAVFLLFSACEGMENFGCLNPSEYDKNTAQSYYDTFGTMKVSTTVHNKVRKKFACYYRSGDKIYAYDTLWGTKYILVRRGVAVTYVE
jgi:hypothetical protein